MLTLIVLENPREWDLHVGGVEVVSARRYLVDPAYSDLRAAKVFNLCSSYRYQSLGYYVSLVAAARGHKPLPAIATIQDLKYQPIVRVLAEDLAALIRRSLAPLKGNTFTLSIYFGGNMAERYAPLCRALFNQFAAPLLRASFRRHPENGWQLESLRPIAMSEIPSEHDAFVRARSEAYFSRPRRVEPKRREHRYDLAILSDPDDPNPPSDKVALARFVRAAESRGFSVEMIDQDDGYGRLGEFDALFIRETTSVNHHTFRFARRAAAEGLVVIDDPESILRCTNKVYLAELLDRHRVPTPRTEIISADNAASAALRIGFPCVVKQPDSSFSLGVVKADTEREFSRHLDRLFKVSELLIVQEFLPTAFDWRVGVLNRRALYVCRYHMAGKHWQIMDHRKPGASSSGRVEAVPVAKAPRNVVRLAVKAAGLIGDGLYGVDVKVVNGEPMVIEVNDNPSIDAGCEDAVLGRKLYERIMDAFVERLEIAGS